LVVPLRNCYERYALGEGFEDCVQARVGDDGGGSLEELELGSVAYDDGISRQSSETRGIESATEGEDELNVEAGAGFSDCFEVLLGAILERAEGGVDKRPAVEPMPGKRNSGSLLVVQEGSGVVKVRWFAGGGELQCLG
jgi:hypothetical protein